MVATERAIGRRSVVGHELEMLFLEILQVEFERTALLVQHVETPLSSLDELALSRRIMDNVGSVNTLAHEHIVVVKAKV